MSTRDWELVSFSASIDIAWFRAPKLKPSQDAVFIAHAPGREDADALRASGASAFLDKQNAYFVTDPADVQPPSMEGRIREMLPRAREQKK